MALTETEFAKGVHGNQKYWQGSLTFDNSYPTGGEDITPGMFGMNNIVAVYLTVAPGELDRLPVWDRANSKIILVVASTGLQAANASDQSSAVINCEVYGN